MAADNESDSDFYGCDETVARLQERVFRADAGVFHDRGTQACNPFADVPYAWQLGESVDDFVSRLPPATTMADAYTPWIYVCNPFIQRKEKAAAGNQRIAGCEDEGPESEDAQTELFEQAGKERLELLKDFLEGTAKMGLGLPGRATTAEIDRAQRSAVRDILSLAGQLGVACGKWMLFVSPSAVNQVWETVVRATIRNELGIAAKVAPRNPVAADSDNDNMKEATRTRLICIYTADFRDRLDVGRVLRAIAALGLLEKHGGRIYYKCDAYTYLGIGATNPWGIRASLYSSYTFLTG